MARVLVTRAAPACESTATGLAERGHQPILAPLRVVQPVRAPLPERPDALIATSANAFIGEVLPADWRNLPIHCVGASTAQAASDAGFTRILDGAGEAKALAGQISAKEQPGATLLWLAGEPQTAELAENLLAQGFRVSILLRYRMIRVPALPETARTALAEGGCDAVLHFSAESARVFFQLVSEAGLAGHASSLQHVCLSRAVARAAGNGLRVIVADTPDSASLLNALDAAFPPAT